MHALSVTAPFGNRPVSQCKESKIGRVILSKLIIQFGSGSVDVVAKGSCIFMCREMENMLLDQPQVSNTAITAWKGYAQYRLAQSFCASQMVFS